MKSGITLVVPVLRERIVANILSVKNWLEKANAHYIDLSLSLPTERFIDQICACEHVDSIGRQFIASQVGQLIQSVELGSYVTSGGAYHSQ